MPNKIQNLNLKNKIIIFICLLVILGIATFFRLWQLDKIPPGIYPDEAINGLNALETAKTNDFRAFYPDNNGREGLWINLAALVFKLAPPNAWSLRLVSVIFGTLTILGLYLLTKELTDYQLLPERSPEPIEGRSRRHLSQNFTLRQAQGIKFWLDQSQCVALTAAFLLAISFWHVNFSRIAFRAILTPFLMVFSFYFLWRYFKKQKIPSLIFSAIFFGLGFYTYIAFRVAVVLLLIAWLPYLIKKWHRRDAIHLSRAQSRDRVSTNDRLKSVTQDIKWWHLLIYLAIITLVSLPLAVYFFNHPEQIMGRASDVAVWQSETPIKNLALSVVKTLGMFNIRGDYNWRHNFSGRGQLLWPVGIFFLVGLAYVIRNIFIAPRDAAMLHPNKRKHRTIFSLHIPIFLLAWFLLLLLPAILTAESLPHALRALGVIPVVYILAGLGLILPYHWAQNKLQRASRKLQKIKIYSPLAQIKRIRISLGILLILVLLTLGIYQYNKYFIDWPQHPETAWAFTQDFVIMGDYLNSLGENIKRFVIVNQSGILVDGIPMPAQTIKYVTYGHPEATYLLPEQIDQIQVKQEKRVNAIIILMADDQGLIKQIQQKYPQNISGTHFGQFSFVSI